MPTDIEMALEIAAQAWCDESTKHTVMDPTLANAFARRLAVWIENARQHARNEDFYRGLIVQIGEMLGPEAYISDDGSLQRDVLCLKVPELVKKLVGKLRSEPCP